MRDGRTPWGAAPRLRRVLLALACLVSLGGHATAAEPMGVSLADTVAGHPGVTYLDLVRQALPDLAPTARRRAGPA